MRVLLAAVQMFNESVWLTFSAGRAVMRTRFTHQAIFAAKEKKINEKLPFASRFNGGGER